MHRNPEFRIIDRGATSWNGQPMVLSPAQNANLAQTANGSMVLAYINQSSQNNAGTLSLTSGGGGPQFLPAPALANQPSILVGNWKASNLSVTNISPAAATPIWIEALGPGLPGLFPVKLPTTGAAVSLVTGQAAQGSALPQWMNLVMSSQTSQLTIFAVVGGPTDPSGNNAYVIGVNAPASTGYGTSTPAPPGYYATTTSNRFPFQLDWGSSTVFVANLSPATAANANVSFYAL